MANTVYLSAKTLFMKGDLDLETSTIKVALVSNAYTPNFNTHSYLSDIPSGARVAISPALTNKVVAGGVFDADDVVLNSVSGNQVKALVLFVDTGNENTSQLIAYLDTGTNLPFTPDGGRVNIVWSDDATKIISMA